MRYRFTDANQSNAATGGRHFARRMRTATRPCPWALATMTGCWFDALPDAIFQRFGRRLA